jgi:hypothetical protein
MGLRCSVRSFAVMDVPATTTASEPPSMEPSSTFLQDVVSAPPELSSKETVVDPMQVPDGGLKAWTTIAGAWMVLFATSG